MKLRVIDIETTGSGPGAEIVEIGHVDVLVDGGPAHLAPPQTRLYRPERGVPPEIIAVHHLTPGMLANEPVCSSAEISAFILGDGAPDVLVAHNCDFERGFISDAHTGGLPWICTYKAALRVWPEAPRHSNQVLRYWRNHDLDPALAMPPHRAGPDAWVTAHILTDLLAAAGVEDLVRWTQEPRLLPRIPFGKHRGAAWTDAPADYLQWMVRQNDMDPDTVWNARHELERRAAASQATPAPGHDAEDRRRPG